MCQYCLYLFNAPAPTAIYTLSLHDALPIFEAFDAIRAGVLSDRSQFYADLAIPFYGANRDGSNVSDGVLREFWRLDRKSTRLNSSHRCISYAVFCLKKKKSTVNKVRTCCRT